MIPTCGIKAPQYINGARKDVIFLFSLFSSLSNKRKPRSLRSADVFPVVASLPPKINQLIFGEREATTGNTSALRRLPVTQLRIAYSLGSPPWYDTVRGVS